MPADIVVDDLRLVKGVVRLNPVADGYVAEFRCHLAPVANGQDLSAASLRRCKDAGLQTQFKENRAYPAGAPPDPDVVLADHRAWMASQHAAERASWRGQRLRLEKTAVGRKP